MFNKEEIIDIVSKLDLREKQYCLIAGASLVMYGVKDITEDIDIVVTQEEFDRISPNYTLIKSEKIEYEELYDIQDKPIEIKIVDNIKDYIGDKIIINNIYCNSVLNEYEWKIKHNRPKDKNIIEKIEILLNKVSKENNCSIDEVNNTMIINFLERKD